MSIKITGLALLGLVAAAPISGSLAQEALAPGSNSFTEGQARGRMQDAGFSDVTDLRKDDQGIWRGRATRNGSPTEVGLDFKGNVVAGGGTPSAPGNSAVNVSPTRDGAAGDPPGTAAGRAVDGALGTNTTGANPGAGARDGTSGNPPSTAVGRAVDRMQGDTPRPDGTPGNPPGTAVGRALGTDGGTTR